MSNAAQNLPLSAMELLPTRLLPDLLDNKADASPLMVFDMGFAVRETVDFFGDRRCRLHFAGIPDTLHPPPSIRGKFPFGHKVEKAEQDEAMHQAWLQRFQSMMAYNSTTRFDLCLFWDYFNYLDDLALKAFSEVLAPFVSPQTLGHAYVLLKEESGVLNRDYGIHARDQISVRPGRHSHLPSFPRPQARVTSMLKGFAVNHSVLRRDGLIEVALKSA